MRDRMEKIKGISLAEEYPYLYETHLHTSQSSACACCTGREMALACKEAGYTGIIVTDHNWGGNTSVNRRMPWKDWVDAFFEGYEDARKMGEKIGLDVFPGYEAGYQGTEFLIYGMDREFMLKHPELRTASIEEQYELVHLAGGIVIHAHPFREEYYIPEIRLFPEYVDGVEGVNATHSNSGSRSHNAAVFDERAIAYAAEHKLPLTAGSDIHTSSLLGGGMAFGRKLESMRDFIKALMTGEDYVLTNGESWFSKNGERLA